MKNNCKLFYLNVIRAIATIIIVIFHFNCNLDIYNIGSPNKILYKTINGDFGIIGVAMFFMLSGAALMYNYDDKINYKSYFKKRFFNIYPSFWLAYIIVFLSNFYNDLGIISSIPKYKLFLSLIGIDGYFSYLNQNFYLLGEWFLGAIIFLYILFPLFRAMLKRGRRKANLTLIVFGGLSLYILIFNPFIMVSTRNIIVCSFGFLLGMYFVKYIKDINWKYALIFSILFVILNFVKVSLFNTSFCVISGYLLFFILVYISKFIKGNLFKVIIDKICKYSYEIFLVHHVIIKYVFARYVGINLGRLEILCLFLIVTIFIYIFCKLLYKGKKKILFYINNCNVN